MTALLGLAVVPYPGSPAAASCAAPSLTVEDHEDVRGRVPLIPGEEVTVVGRGFVDGCDDTGSVSVSPGCSGDDESDHESDHESEPLVDVELVVLQGRPTPDQTSLAVADAGTAEDNQLGQVTWTFVVPRTLSPGNAVLKTEASEPLPVRILPAALID